MWQTKIPTDKNTEKLFEFSDLKNHNKIYFYLLKVEYPKTLPSLFKILKLTIPPCSLEFSY